MSPESSDGPDDGAEVARVSDADEGDTEDAAGLARVVVAMTDVLGINPLDPVWGAADPGNADAMTALDALVQERIHARTKARAARDYATADAIRDELTAAGIAVEDTAAGARWSLNRKSEN